MEYDTDGSAEMTRTKSLNIICAGECMVELRPKMRSKQQADVQHETRYASSFAGDVANFAIYLKRLCMTSSVKFLSATGTDVLSEQMRAFLSGEDINVELLARSPAKTIGLYMIHTDDLGERSFNYWRSDSAAKEMFKLTNNALLSDAVSSADFFYFSGITLAILDPFGIKKLFDLVTLCRQQGKTIIFDPNYRVRLWDDHKQALALMQRSYQVCDILLSSSEDERLLWGVSSTASALDRLNQYNIDEIIITDGPNTVLGSHRGREFQITPDKPAAVVDTTAAGDAFNAGYIAARHTGASPEESAAKASGLASLVIGFHGAIIPRKNMLSF